MTITNKNKYESFLDLVAEMRHAQTMYFKTHGGLDDCKKLERAVDKAIASQREEWGPQQKMWN